MSTILILSLLVLLHEFGHFLIAKLFGIQVEEFGIGLPPKALKLFKHKETEYTLNWLPIGGFVRLAGEDHPSPEGFGVAGPLISKVDRLLHRHMFFAKPAWQRALVILAGVTMNFLVGIAMFSVVYAKLGIPQMAGQQALITQVAKGSPAELADIAIGDILVRVGDADVSTAEQFIEIMKDKKGQMISLYLAKMDSSGRKSESERQVSIIPRENPPEGEGALGVGVSTVPIIIYVKKSWYEAPFYDAVEGTKEALAWSQEFVRIFLHPVELIKNVGGPVAVVKAGQQAAADGWISLLRFGGIISLNLAIFNLLPFPALDGGRLLMLGLEKIVGRKRVAKYEGYVNSAGMGILILLLIVVTVKDLFFS
ncbi:MAG: M50 family metallopeptidase [bacterium]